MGSEAVETGDVLVENFKKKLSRHLKTDVELVINENRSTMLHVLSRKRNKAKLSLHKMFLKAPEEVICAVAHYVGGKRSENKEGSLKIRSFIQTNLERIDYSSLLNRSKFTTQGELYDLQALFDEHNSKYFGGKLDLIITWYGAKERKSRKKPRSRVIFGQYFDHLRLIKIHRMLDTAFFPPYFVSFVVYHEMLHHVVPGYVDAKGLYRTHGAEFKRKEKEFAEYARAVAWEKEHKDQLFVR